MTNIEERLKQHEQNIKKRLRDHDRKIQQRLKDHDRTLRGEKQEDRFLLAFNAFNRKPVYLSKDQLKSHWHILGGTDTGKFKFLEHIFTELVRLNHGVCLIDPHGDLYDELTRYITRHRLEHKTILIDPNEDEWIVGLNYLEFFNDGEKSIHDRVSLVLRAFMQVFGELDDVARSRFERWGRGTFHVLTESGNTLVESIHFLGIENRVLRANILSQVKDPFYIKQWNDFEIYNQQEKLNLLEGVYNSINKFIGHERIMRIVGQAKSTINFRKAMDDGKIVLVNLAPRKFSHELKNMLGVMLIDMILEAATSRSNIPESKRRPFFLMVDEFGELVCDDFAYALDSCRKYKVRLILAHQRLFQLKEDYPNVFDALMSNTEIKFSFGISRENAEIMAKEMFTGKIRGDKIKDEIWQMKFRPHLVWETVNSHSHVDSQASGHGHSDSSGGGRSSFETQSLSPDSGLFFQDVLGISVGESESLSFASTDSSFESSSSADGYSETQVPTTQFEEFKEVSSRTYWTPEELMEKFIAWIKNPTPRHGQLKTGNKGPIAIVTPWVDEVKVRQVDVQTSKEKILSLYARPVKEVDREIKERQRFLLGMPTTQPLDISKEM
ncbi:type IV secretion system DNA-binding domain-containing protein [candidate division KSB1 bacterium]|nr:type IV secretion system DNA-binding domain-containing protein [candidate division KSB1 bacterium]